MQFPTDNVNIPSPVDLFLKMMTSQRESLFHLKHTPLDKNKQKRKEKYLMETTKVPSLVEMEHEFSAKVFLGFFFLGGKAF